jgi:hypothetical protein
MLCACAATGIGQSVPALLANAAPQDGTRVTVQGRLVADHGFINLYSSDRQQCIGLLVFEEDKRLYLRRDHRVVTVEGRLQAQGCGRIGFCVEQLCGPAILRDVELR